jgi:hypothetical protein
LFCLFLFYSGGSEREHGRCAALRLACGLGFGQHRRPCIVIAFSFISRFRTAAPPGIWLSLSHRAAPFLFYKSRSASRFYLFYHLIYILFFFFLLAITCLHMQLRTYTQLRLFPLCTHSFSQVCYLMFEPAVFCNFIQNIFRGYFSMHYHKFH